MQLPTLHRRYAESGQAEERRGVALHLDWEGDDKALGVAVYRRHVRELVSLAPGGPWTRTADCCCRAARRAF